MNVRIKCDVGNQPLIAISETSDAVKSGSYR